jgi:DNA-binding transcriptional regulator YiaG
LKKAATAYRSEIAALKKRSQMLEAQLRRLQRSGPPRASPLESADAPKPSRMGATALKAMRRRFGLSAEALGLLVGVSGQSIYNWESGKSRPHPRYLAVLAFVKSRKKSEVMARLRALGS